MESSISVAVITGFPALRQIDEMFLRGWNLFERNLNTQITPRHHDAIESGNDGRGILDGFGSFHLGQHRHAQTILLGLLPQFIRSACLPNKREPRASPHHLVRQPIGPRDPGWSGERSSTVCRED